MKCNSFFFLRVCISHLENLRFDLLSEIYFDGSNLSHHQQFGTFGHPSPEKRKRDVTRGEGGGQVFCDTA